MQSRSDGNERTVERTEARIRRFIETQKTRDVAHRQIQSKEGKNYNNPRTDSIANAIFPELRDNTEGITVGHRGGRRLCDVSRSVSPEERRRELHGDTCADDFSAADEGTISDSDDFSEIEESEHGIGIKRTWSRGSVEGHRDESPEAEEELESVLGEIGRVIYSKHVHGRHRYVSNVVVPVRPDSPRTVLRELEEIIRRRPPVHWYFIASHGDHVHIGHVCPQANSTCRCTWLQDSRTFHQYRAPRLRRSVRAVELRPGDWSNILRYVSCNNRVLEAFGGFTENERLCHRLLYLSVCIVL